MIAFAMFVGWMIWLCRPVAIDIQITPDAGALQHYDDGAGNRPLSVVYQVRNNSNHSIWFNGRQGSPTIARQNHVDGKWQYSVGWSTGPGESIDKLWTELKPHETVTINLGVTEQDSKFRAGIIVADKVAWRLPFTNYKIELSIPPNVMTPTEAISVFSPVTHLVAKENGYHAVAKDGSKTTIEKTYRDPPED